MSDNELNQDSAGPSSDEVLASVGMGTEASSHDEGSDGKPSEASIQKRLRNQARKHEMEVAALRDQIAHSQRNVDQPSQDYGMQSQSSSQGPDNSVIQQAVIQALRAKEDQDRQAHVQMQQQMQQRQTDQKHQEFIANLFEDGKKYPDFQKVVGGDHAPFTKEMLAGLMLVDSPADVAYKLGQSPDSISRIAELHPLDQVKEVTKLAKAMEREKGMSQSTPAMGNSLNPSRPTPTSTSGINNKMTVEQIRNSIKAGNWK